MRHPKYYDTTPETSRRMSRVRLKRGRGETALAKLLWHKGYRYRLNDRRLPGSPDIALIRQRVAVFVDGEFWHGKDWDRRRQRLKRNRDYWIEKIEENMARDMRVDRQLLALEWTPIHFWSKDAERQPERCVECIEELILERLIEGTCAEV